tara:strand:- start:4830 stop:5321 length:492 start_codon:yes stop_codon:yes gene_type:complete
MIFNKKKHNPDFYNTLLNLSRNIFFYKELNFEDTYETRIYLIFLHYSIILFILKNKGNKPDQNSYNTLFFYIENNLREMGVGDVSVNKKMKDLNKIFYDILLKLSDNKSVFSVNKNLIYKYFVNLKDNEEKYVKFHLYLKDFHKFCFDQSPNSMIEEVKNYKY